MRVWTRGVDVLSVVRRASEIGVRSAVGCWSSYRAYGDARHAWPMGMDGHGEGDISVIGP